MGFAGFLDMIVSYTLLDQLREGNFTMIGRKEAHLFENIQEIFLVV